MIVQYAPVLIWIADATKHCVFFNAPWLAFTGRTMAQEIGFGWAAGVHPDDHDATVASLTDALDSDAQIWTAEYRFQCGDGTYAEILDRGYVLRDGEGAPRRMIGSMLNLTERRSAERERDRFARHCAR